jgi:hypothetical protein
VDVGGTGEGKRNSRVCVAEKFSEDERAPNSPVCVLYYMLSSGGFAAECLLTITKGGSSILGRPGQTRVMSRTSTTRRPVHTPTTVEGLWSSFRHGLNGAVGMIFYAHEVYVVICYMSIICYIPVICLERHTPCIEGPFLVNRTGRVHERHTP